MIETARGRALEACLDLFWNKGPEDAAYPDIVRATGLNRKTLYRFWPEKAALVDETLVRYRETVLAGQLAQLAVPGLAGLTAFWEGQEARAQAPGWRGCYLLRCAAAGRSPGIRRMAEDWLDDLAKALTASILSALRELPRSRVMDPGAAAWQAVGLVSLASMLGSYDARVAALFRAGRLACGMPPA